MLSTTKDIENEVLGVMLVNGGVLIASVSYQSFDKTYTLDQPHTIQQQRTPEGIVGHLVPCVMSRDSSTLKVNIDRQNVLFTYPLPEDVEAAYRTQTGRIQVVGGTQGIQLPR